MLTFYDMPEPSIEPPEDFYITADCGHEVYEGELLLEWENKNICPDCFKDKAGELSIEELAELLRCDFSVVKRPTHVRRRAM